MIEVLISVIIPWILSFLLCGLIIVFIIKIPLIFKEFLKLPLYIKIIFVVIFFGGFLVRFYLTPNQHRILYDEDRYLSYSVTFAHFGEAKSIVYASSDKLLRGDPDQAARLTVPIFNAWIFKIFGYSENNIFIAAKIVSSIQILLIFILAYLMFESHIVAIFAAFGMAFLPTPVYWATSSTLDPYFVFFTLLTFTSIYLFVKKPNNVNGFFLIICIFLLLFVRIEALFSIPIFALILFNSYKNGNSKLLTKKSIFFYSLLFFMVLFRTFISFSVLGKKWCCAEGLPIEAFYLPYFMRNILPNILNLFVRVEFPYFITILSLVGLIKMKNKNILILGVFLVGYFILYSTYYAGMLYSHEFSGSYGRYFLILIPPLLLLAGNTIEDFINYIRNKFRKKAFIIFLISVFIVTYTFLPTIKHYKDLIFISPYYQLVEAGPIFNHEIIEKYLIPNTPKDSIVLTNIASLFVMEGRATSLFASFTQEKEVQDYVFSSLKKHQRVFSIYPYLCDNDTIECISLKKTFDIVPYKKLVYNIPVMEIILKK